VNQQALDRIWYGQQEPGLLLGSLEKLYRWGSALQRRQAAAAACAGLAGKAIVVVGNLTAGGTGKTPLVMRLCELCQQAGLQAAVVSRGYGRRSTGQLQVNSQTPASEAGDEPALIARRCVVPVVVDKNREAAAISAFAAGAELVIADDGLQRLSLPRSLELCVVDGERGFGNRRLLPAGPLREPLARLASVDYVVCNGGDAPPEAPGAIMMQLHTDGFNDLRDGAPLEMDELRRLVGKGPLHAVAGIGNPQRFFNRLRELGLAPDHCHEFADHHQYSASDFAGIDGYLLMTEKDAVKCQGLAAQGALPPAASMRISARLPEDFEQVLVARLATLVGGQAA
jgi:tetraacyldisaccharide 4'-kinase